jgi:hypothetical protein
MRPNPIVRVVRMDREKYALADRLVLTLVVKSALLKCTWPQGVQARKKSTVKKEPIERPGTAGSSGYSEGSTPPIRDLTPSPRRSRFDLGPPPLPAVSHRPSVHASHETTESSGYSEGSKLPIRDPTPSPRRSRFDLGPLPLPAVSHRPSVHASHDFDNYPTNILYSEHYLPLNPMTSREDAHRRHK